MIRLVKMQKFVVLQNLCTSKQPVAVKIGVFCQKQQSIQGLLSVEKFKSLKVKYNRCIENTS